MFSIRNENKNIKRILLITIGAFAAFSLILVLKWGNSTLLGSLDKFDNDDVKYIRSAWTLADTGVITYEDTVTPTVYIMPGLTLVLAVFTSVFGKLDGLVAYRIFQIAIQCFSMYMIFLISRKVFKNSRVACGAVVIDALYLVESYITSLIMMEALFRVLFLLLIYISIYALEKNSIKLYAWAGFVWSLACMFRPPIAVYPLAVLIFWIKNKYKMKDIIKNICVVFVIFCTVMSPWWIRNYNDFHKFIPFTASSGNPFLQGTFVNYDQSEGFGVDYDESDNYIDANSVETKIGLERLKIYGFKNPIKYILWYTLGKTWYLWNSPFYWNGIVGSVISGIWHYFILIFGIAGAFLAVRCDKNRQAGFMISVVIIMNISYLPYYTFSRYAYPLMSIMVCFSAYRLYSIYIERVKIHGKETEDTDSR